MIGPCCLKFEFKLTEMRDDLACTEHTTTLNNCQHNKDRHRLKGDRSSGQSFWLLCPCVNASWQWGLTFCYEYRSWDDQSWQCRVVNVKHQVENSTSLILLSSFSSSFSLLRVPLAFFRIPIAWESSSQQSFCCYRRLQRSFCANPLQ